MRTITHCEKCTEFLEPYENIHDIYFSLCELYIEKREDGEHLLMYSMPQGDLILDFLERTGYLITHEIPGMPEHFQVKPCGLSLRGDELKICTCNWPASFRRHEHK